ncbi:UDP-2,3-diacylglucosamine diphosphatase [Bauldia sp.]|uniref:UDP-2,3-diacylglucosamine diphosphatase n=1 Tax=Bauldia sp. TaxID=2575872 RepID=UPI003BAA7BD7
MIVTTPQPRHFRTLFLSDVHLGCRGCQATLLLDFLRYHDAETVFLVGDIVDGWRLKKSWHWPQEHNDVVQKLLRKGRKGSRIVYVPGNHDEFLRSYVGTHFGGVEVADSAIHELANGDKLLVIHGDQFDVVVRHAQWLAHFGAGAYTAVLGVNTLFNRLRRRLGLPYWSLSAWLKLRVKNAVNYIGAFEDALAAEAKRVGADGVVCGHIHHAHIDESGGFRYVNTGDWVESCTAVAEHHDGRLEIIRWTELAERPSEYTEVDEDRVIEAAE